MFIDEEFFTTKTCNKKEKFYKLATKKKNAYEFYSTQLYTNCEYDLWRGRPIFEINAFENPKIIRTEKISKDNT